MRVAGAKLERRYHCVTPVTRGTRHVLVLELWHGGERACGHRCRSFTGACPLLKNRIVGAGEEGVARGGAGAPLGPDVFSDLPLPFRLGAAAPLATAHGWSLLWQPTEEDAADASEGDGGARGDRLAASDEAWSLFD